MADSIRILHLSDFHFSENRAWDQDPVLTRLAADAAQLVSDGLKPDLVVVTGDIADRGTAKEYELAGRWFRERLLPAVQGTPADLLLVPGNHDVDRGLVKAAARAMQADLLRGDDKAQERIAAILSDADERAPLLKRYASWIEFAKGFGVGGELPWWSHTRQVGGRKLHIAGLCSSWMSWSDEDKGRLLLGRWQVNELLKDVGPADVAVALMHHPWDYFADFDVSVVREEVRRRCALVLRGHWHAHEGETRERPDGAVVEFAAGSCYAGSEYRNAYHLLELDLGQRTARVHLRVWDGHDWIADRNAYAGKAPDGIAEFQQGRSRQLRLRHRLSGGGVPGEF